MVSRVFPRRYRARVGRDAPDGVDVADRPLHGDRGEDFGLRGADEGARGVASVVSHKRPFTGISKKKGRGGTIISSLMASTLRPQQFNSETFATIADTATLISPELSTTKSARLRISAGT